MNFAEYLYHLAHAVFKRSEKDSDIDRFAQAIGPNYDDVMETIFLLREQALVATATGKALDVLGKERNMLRYPDEEDDLYRARLLSAYRIYSADGTIPGITEILRLIGYPNAKLNELFKLGIIVPKFDGTHYYTGETVHKGGSRWSEFTVSLGIDDSRSLARKDMELLRRTISQAKPAHTKLVGMILDLNFKDWVKATETAVIGLSQTLSDAFIRAGFRHNNQVAFGGVLQHDRRFVHGGLALYNRLIPGQISIHRCKDEDASSALSVSLQDAPRIYSFHQGMARRGLTYNAAAAKDNTTTGLELKLDDELAVDEQNKITPLLKLADTFPADILPHGIRVRPARNGEIYYSGTWPHETQKPRSGRYIYQDHITREAGPRRDGRHCYGRLPGDRIQEFSSRVELTDRPNVVVNDRTGYFLYRDAFNHGRGQAMADGGAFALGLVHADTFEKPVDSARIGLELTIKDAAALHYSAVNQVPHNGGYIHSPAPAETIQTSGKLYLDDNCAGYNLYGGLENQVNYDGGGARWKHHGNLLRMPFIRHSSAWSTRDGRNRYLEARARYSDQAVMHDGIDYHGRQRALHDGGQGRTPGSIPENMTIIVRRGYRRIAV